LRGVCFLCCFWVLLGGVFVGLVLGGVGFFLQRIDFEKEGRVRGRGGSTGTDTALLEKRTCLGYGRKGFFRGRDCPKIELVLRGGMISSRINSKQD